MIGKLEYLSALGWLQDLTGHEEVPFLSHNAPVSGGTL